jgi:hypothetical protein
VGGPPRYRIWIVQYAGTLNRFVIHQHSPISALFGGTFALSLSARHSIRPHSSLATDSPRHRYPAHSQHHRSGACDVITSQRHCYKIFIRHLMTCPVLLYQADEGVCIWRDECFAFGSCGFVRVLREKSGIPGGSRVSPVSCPGSSSQWTVPRISVVTTRVFAAPCATCRAVDRTLVQPRLMAQEPQHFWLKNWELDFTKGVARIDTFGPRVLF